MRVVEYDPSRRGDLAGLMGRVWGARPDEARARLVLRGTTRSRPPRCSSPRRTGRRWRPRRSASSGCRSAARASSSGCRFASRPTPAIAAAASSPSSRRRTSERAGELGVRLLLTVPNAASAPVFVGRLGWRSLPPLRVFARAAGRPAPPPRGRGRALRAGPRRSAGRRRPRAAGRRLAQLAVRRVTLPLLAARARGLRGRRAAAAGSGSSQPSSGDLLADCAAATGAHAVIASPPPWQRQRYLRGGYVPTHRSFTRPRQGPRSRAGRSRSARTSSSATSTSCDEDRLRHPGRRSRGREPRRGRRQAPRARRAGRRGRRPRRPRRRRRAARQLPRPRSSAPARAASAGALYLAGAAARARAEAARGRRPQRAALRDPRGAARAAAAGAAPALVHALEARAGRSSSPSGSRPRC